MVVDLTTIEVIKGALIYAAEEMGIALKKSAYSPNIKERMDHSCALFNHKKELVAQAEHIPVHLGSMALGVQLGLKEFKRELEEGDMILLNDPYISGTHLPDLTLIAPIFYEDEIIAYAANKAHHTDIGGNAPGSLAANSSELYQEGLIIPPVKLVHAGIMDSDIVNLIRSNVRTPKTQMGDIRAQIAANNTGIKRINEIIIEHSLETLHKSMDVIMTFSEKKIRQAIMDMPNGFYRGIDYLESPSTEKYELKIIVSIEIKDDEIFFDYTGTSEQVELPLNAPLGVTVAGIYYTMISIIDPNIPVNDGCFRPICLKVPKGCLMNPYRPAPVAGGNVETSQRNVDVLMKAFSQIVPNKVPAAGQGTMNNVTIGGFHKDGNPWTFYETIGGGSGGRPESDGVDGIHVNMTNTMNTPIESMEQYLPLKFNSYSLREDSGGPGKFRGGCGLIRSWTLTSTKATLSIMSERNKIRPWGLYGGKPGKLGKYTLIKKNGEIMVLPAKTTIEIYQDDTLIIETPGGGGYGNPYQRDLKLVHKDVLNKLVSKKSAEKHYGVKILDDYSIDKEITKYLRKHADA
jgi:N-methylhydantoinase B